MPSSIRKLFHSGGKQQILLYAAIMLLISLIPSLRAISSQSDVNIFYDAASRVRMQLNPYRAPFNYGMWYYYSPLFASLLAPFTLLPMWVLKFCWLFLNIFLMLRSWKIMFDYLPPLPEKSLRIFIIVLFLLSWRFIFLNLLYGQLSLLVLWGGLESVYQISKGRHLVATLPVGIGINIKLLPVIFCYLLLLQKQFKLLIRLMLVLALLLLLPYIWFETRYHSALISDWLQLINPLNHEHVSTVGEGGFIDFASLMVKYCTDTSIPGESGTGYPLLTYQSLFRIQMIFRLLCAAWLGWMVLKVHKNKVSPALRPMADLAAAFLIIPAAFPHQRDYSVWLCIPAIMIMLYTWLQAPRKTNRLLIILTLLSFLLAGAFPLQEFAGKTVTNWLTANRIAGFGCLMMIPLYSFWITRPGKKTPG